MKVQNYEVADFWLWRNPSPPIHYDSQIGPPGIYMAHFLAQIHTQKCDPTIIVGRKSAAGRPTPPPLIIMKLHYEALHSSETSRQRKPLPPNYYDLPSFIVARSCHWQPLLSVI